MAKVQMTLIKINGDKGKGRLFCGHRKYRERDYYIAVKGNGMYTLCDECVGKRPKVDLQLRAEKVCRLDSKYGKPYLVKEEVREDLVHVG